MWCECASVLIGATRCSEICENTVLLEGGGVRECSADTVTNDTSAQVENVTPVTLGTTFARDKKTKKNSSVDGDGIRFDVFSSSIFDSAVKY